LGDKLEN